MTPKHLTRAARFGALAGVASLALAATAMATDTTTPTGGSTAGPAASTPAAGSTAGGPTDIHWTPNPDLKAKAEGQVNIIAWAGYAESGKTDPKVDWVTPFTQATGCAVNVKDGTTSDEMVSLMQSGEYDGVSASGDATQRLMAGGEVVAIDPAEFPSYAKVFDDLKLKPWNSADGKPMGVPHGRGANLLVYNTEAVTTAPDSWKPLFEGGENLNGHLSVYDSPIYIADAALYLMATKPELKITNPYALDRAQLDAAMALLASQKSLVGQYWSSYTDQVNGLVDGSVLAGTTWQVIVNLAKAGGAKIDAVKPKEGATGWSDTWMLSSKAKNPNCMKLWMDWIASPWANAQVAEWFGEAPSNADSCALTANKDHCTIFHAGETEYWKDVWYWTTPTEQCLDGRTDVKCMPYSEWVSAWSKLKA